MQEYHRRVTAVVAVPHAEETSAALLAGATLIPLADSGDFSEHGGSVRILGTVYTYSTMDEGDVSGVPSITLDTGLLVDVPAETLVEEWNATRGEVVTDWVATVTDDVDGSSNTAYLTHALIALFDPGLVVGEAVTVRADDDGSWYVTEVHGATPAYDPGFIRTGGLGADTVVWAGTEDGRRAQLDGVDGALECFNDSNVQTVNLDGETNYIEGSLASAASGSRVEIGAGSSALLDTNEVRFYSGDADELEPATIRTFASEVDPGFPQGIVTITAQDFDGAPDPAPIVTLRTGVVSEGTPSHIGFTADEVVVTGDAQVDAGVLTATMGSGSVGTGAFRDSVDARVTAVGGAAYQPLEATLTGIAATTPSTDQIIYATGTDTFSVTALSALARSFLDDTTQADARSTIAAKAARPTVNTQSGTTYTLVLTDEGKIVQVTNAATHTLTVPANASVAFAIGTEIEVFRLGAGAVNIAADVGVTINSRGGLLGINGQYGVVRLRKRLSDTWVLSGDLA